MTTWREAKKPAEREKALAEALRSCASLRAAARRLGVSPSYLSRLLRGQRGQQRNMGQHRLRGIGVAKVQRHPLTNPAIEPSLGSKMEMQSIGTVAGERTGVEPVYLNLDPADKLTLDRLVLELRARLGHKVTRGGAVVMLLRLGARVAGTTAPEAVAQVVAHDEDAP